jgi:serine phosphatase RsbU (regulator of sigma subunit)
MVKVTGADACSIRVLNDDRTELQTMAAYGLSEAYLTKGPILLARSRIDQEVLATKECVYVADQRTDPRVLYPAEARREGIVSALCAPMTYKGGVEGIVRVYTRRPHEFDWFETSLIRGLASQGASTIVNLRLYNEALSAAQMRRQLKLAAEVQRRMVPPSSPRVRGLEISAIYVPCFEVGGDFYDFIEMPDGNLGVCVGDVKGKGLPASLLMGSARASLRAHASHLRAPSEVLAAVNRDMLATSDESDFVTVFYGVLDVPNLRLTYCSAGHEPAMLVRDGKPRVLPSLSGVVGIFADMRYQHQVLKLRHGDVLAISSDGLPEAANFRDEPFGRRRAQQAALAACRRGDSAEGVGKHQLWEMRRFAGLQTRCDDLTLVTIKVQ